MSIWLPYGSSDESVIFRHPLTVAFASNPSTGLPDGAIVPYTTRNYVGSGNPPLVDSVRGMTGQDSEGNNAGVRMSGGISAAQLRALDSGGQARFAVDSAWVATNSGTAVGSEGYTPAALEMALSIRTTATGAGRLKVQKHTSSQFDVHINNASTLTDAFVGSIPDTGPANALIHSYMLPDIVEVNIAWWGGDIGGRLIIAVDGVVTYSGVRALSGADIFQWLSLCNDHGAAYMAGGHYVRNVQISSRVPVFNINQKLRHIGIMSDSIVASAAFYTLSQREAAIEISARKVVEKTGVFPGDFEIQQNSGHSVINVNQFLATGKCQVMRDRNPSVVYINGGTNDAAGVVAGTTTEDAFKDEYNEILEFFMGSRCTEGIYGYTSDFSAVEMVGCITPAERLDGSNPAATLAANGTITGWIQDVVADWDATYASCAGRVKLCDVWTENNGPDFLDGWTSVDNVHPAYIGTWHIGKSIGDSLVRDVLGSDLL